MVPADAYDVFLSHHVADHPAVEEIARRLSAAGIRPWLDSWNLVPGDPWQEGIEAALAGCASCAVFIGPSGIGPWQNEEMRLAIDRRVNESRGKFRVIPVLLPGAQRGERGALPAFLRASTWVEYRQSLEDDGAFHRLVAGIKGIEPGPGPAATGYEGKTPYRGLESFDVDDWPFFFGRDASTEWLLDELRRGLSGDQGSRFLAIIGPSGSGKSSLARAGLAAALKRGCLPGSADWPLVICRPGADPRESLAVALTAGLGNGVGAAREMIESLRQDRRTLHLAARLALDSTPPERRLLLLVDQFEEIFTLCSDEDARRAAIDNLLYAASVAGGQVIVILALRADFYGRCAAYASLAACLTDHQMLVTPMLESELRQAIERPAQIAGVEFEPGLVERLLDDIEGQSGRLPLLEYALLELWNRRSGRRLTHQAYDEIGGVEGALPRRAEAVFGGLTPAEQQVCRRVFLSLVQPNESGETTRRRAWLGDLNHSTSEASLVETVVGKLSGKEVRLITTQADPKRPDDAQVELAHEALIRNWPRLQTWIEEDRQALRIHQEVREAASEWEERGREPSYLYRGKRLRAIEDWLKSESAALERSESAFITASVAQQKAERRGRRVMRATLSVLSLVVFAVLGALWSMYRSDTGLFERQEAWTRVGDYQDPVVSMAVSPAAPDTLFMSTYDGRIMRSQDGGLTATTVYTSTRPNTAVYTVAVSGSNPVSIYGGTSEGTVLRSRNLGVTWENLPDVQGKGVTKLAADAREGETYALAGGSIWKLRDGAAAWQPLEVAEDDEKISAFALIEMGAGPPNLLAGGTQGSFWRSSDGGSSWQSITLDDDTGAAITDIAASPADPKVIYVASGSGLYRIGMSGTEDQVQRLVRGREVFRLGVTHAAPQAVFYLSFGGVVYMVHELGATTPAAEVIGTEKHFENSNSLNGLVAPDELPGALYAATDRGVFVWRPSRQARAWLSRQ